MQTSPGALPLIFVLKIIHKYNYMSNLMECLFFFFKSKVPNCSHCIYSYIYMKVNNYRINSILVCICSDVITGCIFRVLESVNKHIFHWDNQNYGSQMET